MTNIALLIYCIYISTQAVEESLKSVNLFYGGVADKQARKYSGGMKRRLSVAISLIGDPKVQLYPHLPFYYDIVIQISRTLVAYCSKNSNR